MLIIKYQRNTWGEQESPGKTASDKTASGKTEITKDDFSMDSLNFTGNNGKEYS